MPQSQSPQDQRDLDSLAQIIKSMSGSSAEDITSVKKAFAFVERAHLHHKRLSGEPYLKHLSETAQILAELGAGGATVVAGLLTTR